ncbi:PIG-L deacetylase family protein [Entomomonas asaccharolytica]|uniref:PIG-L family deacetylase n=1 Tax=Entomomonas asaccharolytica TaxID=2785331 RepID=A0A974RWT9_9GAMM|nr:PIG-L family deacetylase [Entomomonas asaccharolytica]QQP85477.1 PIG-L family deacetylase [Entomomonas asaccharolytica]
MATLDEDRLIFGKGTSENEWKQWLDSLKLASISAQYLVGQKQRVVLLAPHPDDEVLACGGILALLSQIEIPILIIAVTDGEASHQNSVYWTTTKLKEVRPKESDTALQLLNIQCDIERLEIPDGEVQKYKKILSQKLISLLTIDDIVLSPWILDGHPDHEAVTEVAVTVTNKLNIPLIQTPIWMWHWANPKENRIPWQRARVIELDKTLQMRKKEALFAFQSQTTVDKNVPTTPILPYYVIDRFTRPYEVVFI